MRNLPVHHHAVSKRIPMCSLVSWSDREQNGKRVTRGITKKQSYVLKKLYRVTVDYIVGKTK